MTGARYVFQPSSKKSGFVFAQRLCPSFREIPYFFLWVQAREPSDSNLLASDFLLLVFGPAFASRPKKNLSDRRSKCGQG